MASRISRKLPIAEDSGAALCEPASVVLMSAENGRGHIRGLGTTLSGTVPVPTESIAIPELIDHQAAGGVLASAADANEDAKQTYFCRGCGFRLQPGFRGHFHKECLRADKRRRVKGQRQREQKRFQAWLQHQHCLKCGGPYDTVRSERVAEAPCEASRAAQNLID